MVRGDSTVLVTGAAGFIGAAAAEALMARGQPVIGIDSMNDYYAVSLKEARRDRLQGRFGNLFTFQSEEHTSELQSLMRISYAVFCLKKKKIVQKKTLN